MGSAARARSGTVSRHRRTTPTRHPQLAWCPQAGPQALLLACPADDILFGGARGGGKTDGLLGDAGTTSQRYAPTPQKPDQHFRGLMVRRTYDELDEVVSRSQEIFGLLGATWQPSRYTWRFPWGGFLKLRYLRRDEDASRYQGHSYNWFGKDEAGNFPSSVPLDRLSGTLRDKHGLPIREIASANPGGPGQAWIVDRYILPSPPMVPWRDPETGRVRVYIPSRLEDNRILVDADPGYRNRLKGTGPSWLVAAWLKGDWFSVQEGGVIKSKWWGRYETPPNATRDEVLACLPPGRIVAWVHSWDTASKKDQIHDPSAGSVWAVYEDGRGFLVHVFRKRLEYPELRKAVIDMADAWPCDKVLIEDKSSGTALIQDLRNSTRLPITAVEPENDKVTRAVTSTLLMEAGRMWIPTRAPWMLDFETELTSFPTKGVHDDQVDCVSQFLIWLRSFPLTLIPAVASAATRIGLSRGPPPDIGTPAAETRTRTTKPASATIHRRRTDMDGFD